MPIIDNSLDTMIQHQSVEAAFNLTSDGSTGATKFHGVGALDCMFYFNSGTGSIQLEISLDGLTKWIPVGSPCTTTSLQRFLIPEGVFFCLTVSSASSLDVDITVLDE